jgi:hypothetical protein
MLPSGPHAVRQFFYGKTPVAEFAGIRTPGLNSGEFSDVPQNVASLAARGQSTAGKNSLN